MTLAPGLLNLMFSLVPALWAHHGTKGSFLNRATHYTCTSCAKRVPLTSPEKQRLSTASARSKRL